MPLVDMSVENLLKYEGSNPSMHTKTKEQIENCAQMRMFRLAKECGCKFIFGSDAHDNEQHSSYENATVVSELLELNETNIADIAL